MACKINQAVISVTETAADETQEQGVELDYVLPDYDPEIFRIISCDIQPTVTSYQFSSGKLTYELRTDIRILYCGAGSQQLQCVTQSQHYTKSIDLPDVYEEMNACFQAKQDYATCRAASKRRLDVRGAVSVRIRVTGQRQQEVIQDVFGMNVQLRKQSVTVCAGRQVVTKTVELNEEVSLGASKLPVRMILRCHARAGTGDENIIAGKLVARGEIIGEVLYSGEKEGEGERLESMRFTMPYSQIVDMPQMDEGCSASVEVQVLHFVVKPAADSSGAMRMLQCEAELRLTCTACKTEQVLLVTDAYSTKYDCTCEQRQIRIDAAPVSIAESFVASASVDAREKGMDMVNDLRCRVKNVNIQLLPEQQQIRISGMLCSSVLTQDEDGIPVLLEKEEAFDSLIHLHIPMEQAVFYGNVEPTDCSYHLSADGVVSVKCSLQLYGMLYPSAVVDAVSSVTVSETEKEQPDRDCALRLYYGTTGEAVWDIAKRCSTKVSAIMEENELTGEELTQAGMLFIPIVY